MNCIASTKKKKHTHTSLLTNTTHTHIHIYTNIHTNIVGRVRAAYFAVTMIALLSMPDRPVGAFVFSLLHLEISILHFSSFVYSIIHSPPPRHIYCIYTLHIDLHSSHFSSALQGSIS